MASRWFKAVGGLLTAILVMAAINTAPAADTAALLKHFDDCGERVRAARANKASSNLNGGITWADSYEMDAYLLMYEATQNGDYIDNFVSMADMVNTARADKSGGVDYKGVLHHGWLTDGQYTLGQPATVLDKDGKPSFMLQAVAHQDNNSLTIQITPDSKNPKQFSIVVMNLLTGNQVGNWLGLTMDTLEAKVNTPGSVLKVRKLGGNVPIAHNPFTLPTQRCVLLSHQSGRIMVPLAKVAAMIKKYPDMAGLAHRGQMYLTTAEETFAELENEKAWVDQGEGGYYKIEKGAPIWCDGVPDAPYALSAMGTALLYMNDATGKELYARRATQLATFIKTLITEKDGAAYMDHWYGPVNKGWTKADNISVNTPSFKGEPQPEKIEFLQDTLRFMVECARRKVVFTDADVQAFAKTFGKMYGETDKGGAMWATVAGEQGGSRGEKNSAVSGFMLLGGDTLQKCEKIYMGQCTAGDSAAELYGWAVLNYMASPAAANK
ncbi:hypothetical protein LLG95_14535 [bacterium]|nr:hypothetical protein [bacterium]